MSKKLEKMTSKELKTAYKEFLKKCNNPMTPKQVKKNDYFWKLICEREDYEFVRNSLNNNEIYIKIKDFEIYNNIEMKTCGCCPKDWDSVRARGTLVDGRNFVITFSEVLVDHLEKRSIEW